MKAGDDCYVIFVPTFGLIKVKGRDFFAEKRVDRTSQWMNEFFAKQALGDLSPQDQVKKMQLQWAVVVTQTAGVAMQRRMEAQEAFSSSFAGTPSPEIMELVTKKVM